MSATNSVFSDFCQAWGARFPGSDLPDAWEEDVRANLKKHKTKVAILKEELDKEEMYVGYLQTLLKDIETKKQKKSDCGNLNENFSSLDESKQEFLDSHLSDLKKNDAFVTVINVSSDKSEEKSASLPTRNKLMSKSQNSLRSISSPTTPPTSPLISSSTEDFISREGLAIVNTSSISSSTSSKEPLAELEEDLNTEHTEILDIQENPNIFRGQPDGIEQEIEQKSQKVDTNRASVRELMSNWENRPPVKPKPITRKSKLDQKGKKMLFKDIYRAKIT